MGIPAESEEYSQLFTIKIVKPVIEYRIIKDDLRKLIQRTSKKQMLTDMQKLLLETQSTKTWTFATLKEYRQKPKYWTKK